MSPWYSFPRACILVTVPGRVRSGRASNDISTGLPIRTLTMLSSSRSVVSIFHPERSAMMIAMSDVPNHSPTVGLISTTVPANGALRVALSRLSSACLRATSRWSMTASFISMSLSRGEESRSSRLAWASSTLDCALETLAAAAFKSPDRFKPMSCSRLASAFIRLARA